ncbi:hypothetical protein NQZ68_018229 [Dissostichus eleginoides]|nr:hypothetical protein NQZ68_018229 [Dissostichus eleginoides]
MERAGRAERSLELRLKMDSAWDEMTPILLAMSVSPTQREADSPFSKPSVDVDAPGPDSGAHNSLFALSARIQPKLDLWQEAKQEETLGRSLSHALLVMADGLRSAPECVEELKSAEATTLKHRGVQFHESHCRQTCRDGSPRSHANYEE